MVNTLAITMPEAAPLLAWFYTVLPTAQYHSYVSMVAVLNSISFVTLDIPHLVIWFWSPAVFVVAESFGSSDTS